MELFTKLGIEPVLLVAQVVNFLILIFLLSKFLYKPILKILDEREKKIKDSLNEAERINKKSQEIDKISEEKIRQALIEAQKIVQQAKESGEKSKQEILEKTSQEIEILKKKISEEIVASEKMMVSRVKQEAAEMLSLALTRLLTNLDPQIHHQLIKRATEEIKKIKIKNDSN